MSHNDAIAILRNNHWSRSITRNVWENPSRTQAVTEELLLADPKGAISSIGLDWDSEMRALNSAWGGTPSRYKAAYTYKINPGTMIPVDQNPWETYTYKECQHNWVKYTGLREAFMHCKNCGKKQ